VFRKRIFVRLHCCLIGTEIIPVRSFLHTVNACMGLVKERILFFKLFQVDLNAGWLANTNKHPTVPAIQAALDCAGGSTSAAARRVSARRTIPNSAQIARPYCLAVSRSLKKPRHTRNAIANMAHRISS